MSIWPRVEKGRLYRVVFCLVKDMLVRIGIGRDRLNLDPSFKPNVLRQACTNIFKMILSGGSGH